MAVDGKKKQILNLWKTVFNDSEEFVRLYFDRVYKDENALTIERGGRIASALHMLPYTMTFCGEEIPVAYISGACTLPSEQSKGLMRKLLQQAFGEMAKRGAALTALIPAGKALFNYYRRQGYTEIFDYSLKEYTRRETIAPEPAWTIAPYTQQRPDKEIYGYFIRKLRERQACMLHTCDDLAVILKDLEIMGGQFFVAYNKERQAAGMAFVSPPEKNGNESVVPVKEILCDSEAVKNSLLYEITGRCNVTQALYRLPCGNGVAPHPYGMAKVIDAGRLINLWLAAHPHSALAVNDLKAMEPPALARLLFDYPNRAAYMSLMLD
ncbi:MAG: GNAT family N-acetyltransferase [Bacteroidales bacterium]